MGRLWDSNGTVMEGNGTVMGRLRDCNGTVIESNGTVMGPLWKVMGR